MSGLVDGLGFEEVNQSGTSTTLVQAVSGVFTRMDATTSAYAPNMVASTAVSGVSVLGTNVYATTISGTTLKGTTAIVVTASGTNFVNSQGKLTSVGTGSGTSIYGGQVRAGSGALDAGSVAWILFPTAFTSVPSIVSTGQTTAGKVVSIGSISVGSFFAFGGNASDVFSWIAVGL